MTTSCLLKILKFTMENIKYGKDKKPLNISNIVYGYAKFSSYFENSLHEVRETFTI